MKLLRNLAILLLWLVAVGLAGYEVVQKSPETPLGPLPGAAVAAQAEQRTGWEPATGIGPVDHLVHEGREACLYYRALATGRLR